MFAIRAERDYVVQEDFMKVNESSNYMIQNGFISNILRKLQDFLD